jgi:hypothetical protein
MLIRLLLGWALLVIQILHKKKASCCSSKEYAVSADRESSKPLNTPPSRNSERGEWE